MQELFNKNISVFNSAKDINPIEHYTVGKFLTRIKSGYYKDKIEEAQRHKSESEQKYKDYKSLLLPAVTLSAQCNTRAANVKTEKKLIHHSGLIQIDIDKLTAERQIEIRKQLVNDHHTVFVCNSPSNEGLKSAFYIPGITTEFEHKKAFEQVKKHLETAYNMEVDPAPKDIFRLMFVCWDPSIYINNNPVPFETHKEDIKPTDTPSEVKPTNKRVNVNKNIEYARRIILNSEPGNLHNSRIRAGRLMGGLVGAGYISKLEAFDALKDDILSKTTKPVQALKDLTDAINNGIKFPLTDNSNIITDPDNGQMVTEIPYIRVGTDYYKIVHRADRYQAKKKTLIPWKKGEIIQDYNKKALALVRCYDGFIMKPDNVNYISEVDSFYNLYAEFCHKPNEGKIDNSLAMIKHIFGSDQFTAGLKYMQCLYQNPWQPLPILSLISYERQTGKTTFLNWLNAIFGDNMAIIQSEDLSSHFNGIYANKNIIAVDETLIERTAAAERLKNLSTAKKITVNNKFVSHYTVDFYGKLILCSNKEDNFIKIDNEEVRYWVRKIQKPAQDITNFEELLINEIPAFLYYLNTLPAIEVKSRHLFDPSEITTDALINIKEQSYSSLYKEIKLRIEDFFLNDGKNLNYCFASAVNIKERFFRNQSNISSGYIAQVLKEEFKMLVPIVRRYIPFDEDKSITGRPYKFDRQLFISGVINPPDPDNIKDEHPF